MIQMKKLKVPHIKLFVKTVTKNYSNSVKNFKPNCSLTVHWDGLEGGIGQAWTVTVFNLLNESNLTKKILECVRTRLHVTLVVSKGLALC